jgi:hypothetical protein
VGVPEPTTDATAATHADLLVRAERDMFQEGYALADCTVGWELTVEDADGELVTRAPYTAGDAVDRPGKQVSLQLTVAAALPHPELAADREVESRPAPAEGTRKVRSGVDRVDDVPVHVLDDLVPATAESVRRSSRGRSSPPGCCRGGPSGSRPPATCS